MTYGCESDGLKESILQILQEKIDISQEDNDSAILEFMDLFLEYPYRRNIRPPAISLCNTGEEIATLDLCLMYPWAIAGSFLENIPTEDQSKAATASLETGLRFLKIAEGMNESCLYAMISISVSRALLFLGEKAEAISRANESFEILNPLSKACFEIFSPLLNESLKNLIFIQRGSVTNQVEIRLLKDHLYLNQRINNELKIDNLADIARIRNNLASLLIDANQHEEALSEINQAIIHYESLESKMNFDTLDELAGALRSLALASAKSGLDEQVCAAIKCSVTIRRYLLQERGAIAAHGLVKSLSTATKLSAHIGELDESPEIYEQTIAALREQVHSGNDEFRPDLTKCLSNFSEFNFRRGNVTEALELATEAAKVAEELSNILSDRNSRFTEALIWNRISSIFQAISDHERATEASLKAAAIARQCFNLSDLPDLIDYGAILANLNNHARITDPHLCIDVGLEAIAIMRKACHLNPIEYLPQLAILLSEYSITLHAVNRLQEAEIYSREALSAVESLHLEHGIESSKNLALIYGNLSGILLSQNRVEEAISIQDQVINIHCGGMPYEEVEIPTAGLAMAFYTMGTIILFNELQSRRENAGYFFERAVEVWNWIARKDQRQYLAERAWSLHYLGVCIFSKFIFSEHERCYDALLYFRESISLTEELRESYHIQDNRDAHQLRSLAHYGGLAQACLSLWEKNSDYSLLDEAAQAFENWRSRRLLELYLLSDFGMAPQQQSMDSSVGADSKISTFPDNSNRSSSAPKTRRFDTQADRFPRRSKGEHLTALNARLDQIEVGGLQSILAPKTNKNPSPQKLKDPRECIPNDKATTLVMLAVLPIRTVALIFRPSEAIFPHILPNLAVEDCVAASENWISHYRDFRGVCLDSYADDHEKLQAQNKWKHFVSEFLDDLSYEVIQPLWNSIEAKKDGDASLMERLMIMPHGPFQNYPLHSCVAKNDHALCDLAEIVIVPSASLVAELASKPPSKLDTFLVVSNTVFNLPFSSWETSIFQEQRSFRSLAGSSATIKRAMKEIPLARYFLFSGHAIFDPDNPVESGLKLNDGVLTIKTISESRMLEHCELVFLNGCETALLNPSFTDDHFSLPSACLQAGAKCVISTLWTVDDIPASLFSFKFHQLWDWGRGQKVGAALNNASRWLRGQPGEPTGSGRALLEFFRSSLQNSEIDLTSKEQCLQSAQQLADQFPDSAPFEHPIHWAAYVVHGVAW